MRKPWTDDDLERAKRLYALGYSPKMIGDALGRRRDAVYSKLRHLGVAKPCRRKRGAALLKRRHVTNPHDEVRNPWHPVRDPIPARYDWFHGARQEQTAV